MTIDRLKWWIVALGVLGVLISGAKVGQVSYDMGYDAGLIKGYTVSYKVVRSIGEGPAISFLDKMEAWAKGGKI